MTQRINDILYYISDKFNDEFNGNLLFSVRGVENFHIYLWLLKDLFWSLNYTICGTIFGLLAIFFTNTIMYNRCMRGNTEDVYFSIPLWLWLFGNFWWMRTEFVNDQTKIDSNGRIEAGWILITAYCISLLYYIVLKWWPKNFIKNDPMAIALYVKNGYVPYFTFFENWKQYEFFHMVCWLTKDIGWCFLNKYVWFVAVILVLIVSLDFIRYSLKGKRYAMDLIHYVVQLVWLIGNIVWSTGEIFNLTRDTPHTIFSRPDVLTCRWIASIIFTFAFSIVITFNILWVILTKCKYISEERNMRFDGIYLEDPVDQL
jgi:hypothetical protein